MQENLTGLSFYIDQQTGAIVAEEDFGPGEGVDGVALLGSQRPYDGSIPLRADDAPSP